MSLPSRRNGKGLPGEGGPGSACFDWWRGQDLSLRPSGYEPDEQPSSVVCSRLQLNLGVARNARSRTLKTALQVHFRAWSSASVSHRCGGISADNDVASAAVRRSSFDKLF